MLNHFEKMRLRAIEQSLATEDPEFAERFKNSSAEPSPAAEQPSVAAPLMFGAVFALLALPVSPVLAAVILAVPVIIALWIRVLTARILSATDERPAAEPDEK